MSDDLLIKIDADVKGVQAKYDEVIDRTTHLNDKLSELAKLSGIAFAAMSAQVLTALHAFNEADQASKALSQSLQNQGIFTEDLRDSYKGYAEEVQRVTGFNADQLVQAQAVLQSQIGQIPITQKLTNAVADLAQKQGVSLPAAAEELGRAIANGSGQLLRMGLSFAATDTEADRLQKTLDFVQLKAGGMAAAANTGIGSIRGLEAAFHQTQEELGARFAPAAEAAIKALTGFLTPAKDSTGAMVDLKAALLTVGLGLTAVGVAIPVLAQGFIAAKAAAIAFNLELNATKIALYGLGIGLVIGALTELALHWDFVSTQVKAIVKGLVTFVSEAFNGMAAVLDGAFTLNPDRIKEGLNQIKKAFSDSTDSYKSSLKEQETAQAKHVEVQDANQKTFADKSAKEKRESEKLRLSLLKAENELVELEIANASVKVIDLKKQEIAELTALTNKKQGRDKELLVQQLHETRKLEVAAVADEKERTIEFAKFQTSAKEDLAKRGIASDSDLDKKEIAKIKATLETAKDVHKKAYAEELSLEVKKHNTFLEEQNKYSTAYAAINQTLHSTEVSGLQQSGAQLAQLASSNNSTLKGIGKAFAIEQSVIHTAEGALSAYTGFVDLIPGPVGMALGAAAAAVFTAFGVEQIGKISAAQSGGVVGGVGSGDKMPFLLEPGELIAPKQNFDEVVNAVAASRSGASGESGNGVAHVVLSLKGNLMDFVEAKLVQRKFLKVSLQGSR